MTEYHQRVAVTRFHDIPRFGHPNRIANVVSLDSSMRSAYINGMIAFLVTLGILLFCWGIVLLVLKFSCGIKAVGCAAGGDGALDVAQLRRNGVRRAERKARIVRNWRVQLAFLLSCMLLPALSFLFVNHGLNPFYDSLYEVDNLLTDEVIKHASRGSKLANSMMGLNSRLDLFVSSIKMEDYCPNLFNNETNINQTDIGMLGLESLQSSIEESTSSVVDFVKEQAPLLADGLYQLKTASEYVQDNIIHKATENDWIIKGLLIGLNVVNVFFFLGVLLSRNGIQRQSYQDFLTFVITPLFCALLVAVVVGTGLAAIAGMLNADFCAGGDAPGSPFDTMNEMLFERGFNESDLAYQSFQYYSTECNGTNPLDFLQNIEADLSFGQYQVKSTLSAVNDINITAINAECGSDATPMIETLNQVLTLLGSFTSTIDDATNLTSCATIEPIFQELIHGAPCSESVRGLSWLFGTTLAMAILGLVMLSLRAALYNPVLKPRRIKRREREFREYKDYMSEFYDTDNWFLDPPIDGKKDDSKKIVAAATFETEGTESSGTAGSPSSPEMYLSDAEQDEALGLEETPRVDRRSSDRMDSHYPASVTSTARKRNMARVVAAAVTMVGDGLSTFNDYEPEIEYYSSDSDEESDEENNADSSIARSESSGMTQLSGLVSRFFVVKRRDELPPESLGYPQRQGGPVVPPAFLTPRRRRRQQEQSRARIDSNDADEAKQSEADDDDVSSACPYDEKQPLTPPPQGAPGAVAPHKHRKTLGRTLGGSKLCKDEI